MILKVMLKVMMINMLQQQFEQIIQFLHNADCFILKLTLQIKEKWVCQIYYFFSYYNQNKLGVARRVAPGIYGMQGWETLEMSDSESALEPILNLADSESPEFRTIFNQSSRSRLRTDPNRLQNTAQNRVVIKIVTITDQLSFDGQSKFS